MAGGTAVSQTNARETNLKAAFIYNFTRYVEWENETEDKEFIIGIMGSFSENGPMREIASTHLVKNKRIILKNFRKPEDITNCHILFIPGYSPFPLQAVLEKTGKGVLTISEVPGFASRGTAINFVVRNNQLKFEINLKAMYSAGLKASSQLLKLAIIVD